MRNSMPTSVAIVPMDFVVSACAHLVSGFWVVRRTCPHLIDNTMDPYPAHAALAGTAATCWLIPRAPTQRFTMATCRSHACALWMQVFLHTTVLCLMYARRIARNSFSLSCRRSGLGNQLRVGFCATLSHRLPKTKSERRLVSGWKTSTAMLLLPTMAFMAIFQEGPRVREPFQVAGFRLLS
jgi:hypothetical protein